MSVLEAVTRAMRSGHVITPGEFSAIHREALATVDLSQIQAGDYLLRGEDAEALRGARFRNDAERRTFYVSFLNQARNRVLGQLHSAISAIPAADRLARLRCYDVVGAGAAAQFTPAACFTSADGSHFGFHAGSTPEGTGHGFSSGILRYLGVTLPSHAFLGLIGSDGVFSEIQLLDGVQFTAENFRDAELPADTRISAASVRMIYRTNLCTDNPSLPECN